MSQHYSPGEITRRTIERRAVEAVIWGMPAVNASLMLDEMRAKFGGQPNQIVYWSQPLDWHCQLLTPNPDSIYMLAFFDTKEAGPVVLDNPPGDTTASLNGNVVTVWQTALEDVGLKGIDKGAGGKFVILPPGFSDPMPDGYTVLRSDTFSGYALLRSNLKSYAEDDIATACTYARKVKIYPLSRAGAPPPTVFHDAAGIMFDATIRYDLSFFQSLDRIVQYEPWIDRDRVMIDLLRSIGIVKGQPFAPDAATRQALTAAIGEARTLLEQRYSDGFPPFWDDSKWTLPAAPETIEGQATTYSAPDQYTVDGRGLAYSYIFVSVKRLGAGQFYLFSMRDNDGADLDGGRNYRLNVPARVPVDQYWSLTAYDRVTHSLIKNVARSSRSSQLPEVARNLDGSIDIYLGPTAPAGNEPNWLPTDARRGFELIFRFYGPRQELFEKNWVLPDVTRI